MWLTRKQARSKVATRPQKPFTYYYIRVAKQPTIHGELIVACVLFVLPPNKTIPMSLVSNLLTVTVTFYLNFIPHLFLYEFSWITQNSPPRILTTLIVLILHIYFGTINIIVRSGLKCSGANFESSRNKYDMKLR